MKAQIVAIKVMIKGLYSMERTQTEHAAYVNRKEIYQLLWKQGALSRAEIAEQLGLSLPTVAAHLTQMRHDGIIELAGYQNSTGGRRAQTYQLVAHRRIAIGVELTRQFYSIVAVDLYGKLLHKKKVLHEFLGNPAYFKAFASEIQTAVQAWGLAEEQILGVAIGVPGLLDRTGQKLVYSKALTFTQISRANFAEFLPYATYLFHDATAAGNAETWSNRELQNAFYLMINDGIAGAVIIDGAVYAGENLRSAEVCHMKIVPDGRLCYCGQRGCANPYCTETVLTELSAGSLPLFFNKLEQKDEICVKRWKQYLRYLATTVNNVQMLLDSHVIIGGNLGGVIGKHIDDLRSVAVGLNPFDSDGDYICPCKCKEEAIALGASMFLIEKYIMNNIDQK